MWSSVSASNLGTPHLGRGAKLTDFMVKKHGAPKQNNENETEMKKNAQMKGLLCGLALGRPT